MAQVIEKLGSEDLAFITDKIPYHTIMSIRRSGVMFYLTHYERVPIYSYRLDSGEWEDRESVYYIRETKYNSELKEFPVERIANRIIPNMDVVTPTEELGRALAKKLNENEKPRRNAWLAETNTHPTYNGHRGNVIFIKTSHFRP